MFRKLWYKILRRPYRLYCRYDQGKGRPVVLLHGIASSGASWQPVIDKLTHRHRRVIVFDLLGFGESPKPIEPWVHYDIHDHARAVIAALERQRVHRPATLVGHSMGCFVAIEVAAMRPDLVQELILYEPPFYTGLPNKSVYKLRQALYFRVYSAILRGQPLELDRFSRLQKLVSKRIGVELTNESWVPFTRSLQNTIMSQAALDDIKILTVPTQIIYGRFDQLVINDVRGTFFDKDVSHITVSQVASAHVISKRAAETIAKLILEPAAKAK